MKVTFLGTGTSQGVPIIGCSCKVCTSEDPRDKRLRCSMFIEVDGLRLIIDTGPDFRQQLLANNIKDVDAILYTHDMPLYAEAQVITALEREFHYAFSEVKYPGVPQLQVHQIDEHPFHVQDVKIIPIRVLHHKLPVLGFRIKNFAYVTDANFIAEEEQEKLKGLDVLVLNGLRHEKHISHYSLSEAVEVIQKLEPKQAFITHISHLMDKHEVVNTQLPKNIRLGFDGLCFEL